MSSTPVCRLAFGALLCSALCRPAQAGEACAADAWTPVDAAHLDATRGGFVLPSGIAVGLGIERSVAVNGELVTQTRFAVADVRQLTAEQAGIAQAAIASVQFIRDGAPVPADPALGLSPGITMIQNSLNDQQLQSRTVIDASVNTLANFKALNFSASVVDALARAAAPH